MGYTTTFEGQLTITNYDELPAKAVDLLNSLLGEDIRYHPSWQEFAGDTEFYYIDLKRDCQYLMHDGSEKTYDMIGQINFILDLMAKKGYPITIEGTLVAAGEDPDDRWKLVMVDNRATEVRMSLETPGERVCPKCGHKY